MKPKVIKTDAEYQATLARIEKIFDARPGTAKGDELELLVFLVETYEEQAYPIDPPDPIAATAGEPPTSSKRTERISRRSSGATRTSPR